ncbi:MAG: Fe-S protein assembly co-chaperone HscB [Candidatus Muproteobacteria bacterium RIFCSPHIGHO2_12_FULL_60_33]|uniref:Co-chaperone protein HscB homolog n=1 Tax=Candidatus Muproteobacteria bacterium RIFCSPLOWO2_01_FULL_60_18 TaxID=1817768 RepID=A0A1F6U0Z6_9PROT|nr:MAG: Fe-S protein assembly co-chaperone HscB [Candidatus Muproteobacteria bacterium RIFCSPHIGHO2_01_60_12]OGI50999.1 MAG: Fe-S protein assembly co-chaperone HscB [Candidatus Muproteobacteria bacterium RIFCSPLOWO2_01_FULL_60_18]OGI54028.1 MAG: Fe-S protein assembly co-chaperone HscB [Candidatus Muproteobacteria bacterium RIFCSPHIGHO2_02_FULL_60_13]OGI55628.1 MAG: Fe-S protein assembly co-chaperone HscB [Candidatus Muproteobacteria bacterium RIFCSPHIGHO2_12_FULL_60_33]OGI59899.1 MAG: Fe-S prot
MHAAAGKNHFELFGLPVAFDLDANDLASRYRELQRHVHPDKFANASDQERRLSLQMTALVNEAFQTLKDPVRRGRYLLGLRGVDVGGETDTKMDAAFLMEQMEWRENLEEIRQADNPRKQLAELANRIGQRMQDKIGHFRRALDKDSPEEIRKARNIVREMQFLEKMQQEIDNLEYDFETQINADEKKDEHR